VNGRIPKGLKREPLVEAICEIRFSSSDQSVIELLPGLIYQAFEGEFKKIERLPAGNLPPALIAQDAALRYIATVQMKDLPYTVQIGEHVVSLSCSRPYIGWSRFKAKILEMVDKVNKTGLVASVERFGLKYLDVIPAIGKPSLNPLNVKLKLGGRNITSDPVQLRTEYSEDGFVHVIQVVTPVKVASAHTEEHFEGILTDIDIVHLVAEKDFWQSFSDDLESAHNRNKELFFGLLKRDTIEALDPEY
jgi:uncharacterized protein (TIGR04255 family)